MAKYIETDKLKQMVEHKMDMQDTYLPAHFFDIVDDMPAADVEPRWIPVTERLPENTDPVNITWVNRKPSGYYKHIKDKPFVATGHYCNGRWYWFSAVCQDYLNEYGDCKMDRIDPAVEIVAWQPLPSPYKGGKE